MKDFVIHSGLQLPIGRPERQTVLNDLVNLAETMKIGDAVELRLSEAQMFRIILAAQGYHCITDGYRCQTWGKTLAFKL